MASPLYIEFTIILVIAVTMGVIMRWLKLPLILGYVISGILVSPVIFGIMESEQTIEFLSEIGIAFLLFIVGLSLNLRDFRKTGMPAAITGAVQVALTFGITYLITILIGFSPIHSAYIAIALSFSSTIIVLKLLSDRHDLDALHGRLAVGILIFQDLVAIFVLTLIASMNSALGLGSLIGVTLLKLLAFAIGIIIIIKIVIPRLDRILAHSHEMVFISAITSLLLFSAVFSYFGLSLEIGALLAGICFASSNHRFAIREKTIPLRDFFIILFFILIGTFIDFGVLKKSIFIILLLSVIAIIIKPIIIMGVLGILKNRRRHTFYTGTYMSQISEFSLVVILLGISMNHITPEILSIITSVMIISISVSAILISNVDKIFLRLSDKLKVFERKDIKKEPEKHASPKVVLLGYTNLSYRISLYLKRKSISFLIVDDNPERIADLKERNMPALLLDLADPESYDMMDLSKTQVAIICLKSFDAKRMIISILKENKIMVFVEATSIDDVNTLYGYGATYVLMPHLLGGEHIVHLFEKHGFSKREFNRHRKKQLDDIERRKRLGNPV